MYFKNAFLVIILTLVIFNQSAHAQTTDSVKICFHTSLGDVHAILYTGKARITCANFLDLVRSYGSRGGEFYRTVTKNNQPGKKIFIEVIQGGFSIQNIDTGLIHKIPLERTNMTGILHKDGTLSMARDEPNTASTEFFICIGDQPSLDYGGQRNPDGQGFAAFGKVTDGMDIVRKIQNSPSKEQVLTPGIKIQNIYIEN